MVGCDGSDSLLKMATGEGEGSKRMLENTTRSEQWL